MLVGDCATRKVVCVAPSDSIDTAIVLMEEHGVHHLPVVSGDQVVGMLSDRDVLFAVGWNLAGQRFQSDYDSISDHVPMHIYEIMSRPVVRVLADDTVRHAARIMVDRRIGALPVLLRDRVSGILTETDLLRRLEERAQFEGPARDFLSQPVGELMRGSLITVEPHTSLGRLVELIQRRRIRHLPVVSDGTLVGMISDRDIRRALGERNWLGEAGARGAVYFDHSPAARDIMSRDVQTVSLHHTVADAVHRLLSRRIHALPVCRAEREAVGIVTQTDVVLEIARADLF